VCAAPRRMGGRVMRRVAFSNGGLRWWMRALAGLLLALGALAAAPAHAGCKVATAPGTLAFGAYKPITFGSEIASADVESQVTFTIGCNQVLAPLTCLLPLFTSNYTLTISAGNGGSPLTRQMTGSHGGPNMNYNLYTTSGRTVVWGNGTLGTSVASSITGCNTRNHTIYGKIPLGQKTLKPGSFGDALVVTVTFAP